MYDRKLQRNRPLSEVLSIGVHNAFGKLAEIFFKLKKIKKREKF